MKQLYTLAAAAVMLGLVAGCNTPARRIHNNPKLFASFPAAAQAQIRQGQVAPGFTRPMVKMALGQPDRVYNKETAGQTRELWTYVGLDLPPGAIRDQEFDVVHSNGKGHSQYRVVPVPNLPLNQDREREYDRIRVEFAPDGTAACIETLREK